MLRGERHTQAEGCAEGAEAAEILLGHFEPVGGDGGEGD